MSAFSDRVRNRKTGFFKVADLEGGKESILTISYLDEEVEMFGKTVDILNFVETGQQPPAQSDHGGMAARQPR
jgi:hypothetical protein